MFYIYYIYNLDNQSREIFHKVNLGFEKYFVKNAQTLGGNKTAQKKIPTFGQNAENKNQRIAQKWGEKQSN